MYYFESALQELKKINPKIKVIDKNKSTLHKIIGVLIHVFNKNYDRFWTTIGFTIARPENNFSIQTLWHEGRHVWQAMKFTRPLFSVAYLFPQILSLLTVPLYFCIGWWSLLFMLFVLPIPSYPRMVFELQAYKVSIAVRYWINGNGSVSEEYIDAVTNNFVGGNYYFMWPFRKHIKNKLMQHLQHLKENEMHCCENDEYLNIVRNSLKCYGIKCH